ncbi:endonuclease III [Candidatus Marinamargulisbacteria bacterium SCGC AG-439-L15]|nr:endonuclease III [Candidatus Marinamargulisbacteria bacterium SCGC AG-439-L15]
MANRDSLKKKKERAKEVFLRLEKKYPNVGTFLTHQSPYELLIAVILSAQCTDERVNKVTPALFKTFPTPKQLAEGESEIIKKRIASINFFNTKSKNIKKCAQLLVEKHNETVPDTLEELIQLPGVGRKTANVVLGQAFNTPGITVDTHVKRVSTRLGFTNETDPVKIEFNLMKVWEKETWINLSSTTILHGRHTCKALNPICSECFLKDLCPQKGVLRQR